MQLELLAPAKDKSIGIAAIDCGADAVYIAGPKFGAREAAGNSIEEIAQLADYAHRFNAKVFVTINTILYENELKEAEKLIWDAWDAGADALIVQDLGILKMNLPPIELHASTQTVVKDAEQAKLLSSLGFTRLVLERQLSLDEIKNIREAVDCELEAFVHGALCVCYSGRCYLSQYLAGRSANRGCCIQACRSQYDLVDEEGRVLLKNRSILSLKDFKLDDHIAGMVEAGICSFKIEGRLKSASYVKNVVRHYRKAIDAFIASNPAYCKSSLGCISGGFEPNIDATFNRGYTSLFIDGNKGRWNSGEAAKSMGEYIGKISMVGRDFITINTEHSISNGDGLAFVSSGGEIVGSRVEKCSGSSVFLKDTSPLFKGQNVYRNFNIRFEKELNTNMPQRLISVEIDFSSTEIKAFTEDGLAATIPTDQSFPVAEKKEKALDNIKGQLGKSAGEYTFKVHHIDESDVRFYPTSYLNAARRELAQQLREKMVERHLERRNHRLAPGLSVTHRSGSLNYLANCSNSLSKEVYSSFGFSSIAPAYELAPEKDAELMRSRYCIKYELGLCSKSPAFNGKPFIKELFLVNNNNKLRLEFDCKKCEMIIFSYLCHH